MRKRLSYYQKSKLFSPFNILFRFSSRCFSKTILTMTNIVDIYSDLAPHTRTARQQLPLRLVKAWKEHHRSVLPKRRRKKPKTLKSVKTRVVVHL